MAADAPGKGRVAGIILAAGRARRMGRLKQLLPFQGRPMLSHVLDHGAAAGLSPLVLVLGCGRDRIREAIPQPRAEVVLNRAWESGMASSIAAGLAHLKQIAASGPDSGPGPEGALFLLGDQPLVDTALIRSLLDRAARTPDRILVPTCRGKRGNPVYFPARFFGPLQQLSGNTGGRQIFTRFPEDVLEIPVDTPAVCRDIDTPEDYDRLCGTQVP